MEDLINGRCGWCGTDELYMAYHDQEWGKLVTDDKTLFEFLVLESSQAGLSWITILRKAVPRHTKGVRQLLQLHSLILSRQKTDYQHIPVIERDPCHVA